MGVEENKDLARRFEEELHNQQRLDVIDDIIADDFENNGPTGSERFTRETFKEMLQGNYSAYPDLHDECDEMLGAGEFVAFRLMRSATVDGEKKSLPGFHLLRIRDGKIDACWWMFEGM